MHYVDLSGNPRIPIFLRMASELGSARQPGEVLAAFLDAIHDANGWSSYIHVTCCDLPRGQYRILRHLNFDREELIPFPTFGRNDIARNYSTLPIYATGIIAELILTPEPKLLHDVNVSNDPALGDRLAGVRCIGAVPMLIEGREDEWIMMLSPEPEGFSTADLEANIVFTNMISSKLVSANLAIQLAEAKENLDGEVQRIAQIQRSLLPPEMPSIAGLQLAASYETFDQAGGDYYDFISYENGAPTGLWGMIVADASGHGPAAAVVMAMVHTLFHSYQGIPEGPVALIEYINTHLQSTRIQHAFVTAFVAIFDPKTRELRYARAGHDAPLLMDPAKDPKPRRLDDVNGFPLGVAEYVGSPEGSVTLRPGQTLVLYTDGITEARAPSGKMFRLEGIEDALVTCNGKPDCVVLVVNDALKEHEAGIRARDDQTLVAMHVE